MTNETGLLRDLNLKPGDRVTAAYTTKIKSTDATVVGDSIEYDYGGKVLIDDSYMIYTVTHREPRTIGTLKEIGAKVGDVVQRPSGNGFTVTNLDLEQCRNNHYRIISRAAPSPVRTVTKKEIVPGVYGVLTVRKMVDGDVGITVDAWCDPSELDTLIQHLQDIREAM